MAKKLFYILTFLTVNIYAQVPTANLVKEYLFTNGSLQNTATSGGSLAATGTSRIIVNDILNQPNALQLNGDELNAGTRGGTVINRQDVTISFWLKTSVINGTPQNIIQQYGASGFGNYGWFIELVNGKIRLSSNFLKNGNSTTSARVIESNVIANNEWNHISIVLKREAIYFNGWTNGIRSQIYVNGNLDANSTFGGATSISLVYVNPDASEVKIASGANKYNGVIDNLRTYNRALTGEEIINLYKEFTFRSYVDKSATGNNSGRSWANAFVTLHDALASNNTEIWVKKGTYTPHATDRNSSFIITNNKSLYGGFNGNETSLSQRNFKANPTILSGDLSNNDSGSTNYASTDRVENSYNVVRINDEANSTTIDGFTVSGGFADSASGMHASGAAIFKEDNAANLTIKNSIVKNNAAFQQAGVRAFYKVNGSFTLENCEFSNNISQYASSFYVFSNNRTITVNVSNSLFSKNVATTINTGGGYSASAGWVRAGGSSATISATISANFINNTYANNIDNGTIAANTFIGTIGLSRVTNTLGVLNAKVYNCIFQSNTANQAINAVLEVIPSSLEVRNSLSSDNFPNANTKSGIVTTDALFVDTANSDFTLQTGSPAKDSGDNSKLPIGIIRDLLGNQRIFNTTVDMGAYEFGSSPITNTVWTGTTNTNWSTIANWTNGLPTSILDAVIPNVSNKPVIDVALASVKNLEVQAGSSISVSSGKALTIEGNLTQNGMFTINSNETLNGSLILKGTQSGSNNVTYNRYVTGDWHLLGAPVDGQNIVAFKNDLITSTNGIKYSIATYNNALASSRYAYYTTAVGANDINNAGAFIKAKGYSVKKSGVGTFAFSGSLNTTDVSIAITDGSATGNKHNLISNPYTSSLYFNVNANVSNNFLTQNMGSLDPTAAAMYVWNASTNSYDIINQATPAKYLAPGQGFFVASKTGGATIQFTEAMQNHQVGNIFSRGNSQEEIPSIKIMMTNGNSISSTEVKYIENTSVDLDSGYDARVYSEQSKDFNVYTRLVSNNNTTNFALQCLPNVDLESMVIPLGVSLKEGKEVVFNAETTKLPLGMNVFIEDTVNKSFTNISKGTYSVKLSSGENVVGRFKIHTSLKENLDINEEVNNGLTVFESDNKLKVLTKNQGNEATVKVFDLLGKEVFVKTFISKGINEFVLPKISTGIYIIHLSTENEGKLSKKIIIE